MKRLFIYCLLLFSGLACSSAWASSYYASLTTKVANTGGGKVYASTSKSTPSDDKYAESSDTVKSNSTSTSGGNVTLYAFAKADDGYEFKGWAASASGATSYTSTDNPWAASLAASTTKDGTQPYTYYAYFEKETLASFSVTFLAPQNGSYTVDGISAGSEGLVNGPHTEVYTPKLVATAADGYAFNGWYTTTDEGETKKFFSNALEATYDFTAAATVGADFVKSITVITADELLYSLEHDTLMEIPDGVTITIESGTLANGKTLIINGDLFVSGTFTNNGTIKGGGRITTYIKQVKQTGASGDTPFETTCVVASYNKKYYKTEISALNGKISGTAPTCNIQNAAKVVRNGVTIAECVWPSNVTPAVLCCTVDPNKAVNHITGFDTTGYYANLSDALKVAAANVTTKMLVLMSAASADQTTCVNAGLTYTTSDGKYTKLKANLGVMDLAGSTLTVKPSYIDTYTHTLLNGGLSVTTLIYSSTLNCINLSSLSLTKLKEDYASVVNIYDCKLGTTKVPKAYNGSNANKNKVNFYSSGDNIYSTSSNFNTQNPTSVYKIYGGRWSAKPAADYNGAGSDYDFYQTSDTDTSYSLKLKTDQTVVTFDNGSKYESLADAFNALSTLSESSVKMTIVKNATLASAVTIPAGKTVEIELDGCSITAANGFVVNNGTFLIGDRRGNIAADGGRVITSAGNFLVNNGIAEITYGYYTGNVVLNGGELTTHYGRFTGNFSAATGVDKTTVANFRGGYFDNDVTSFLRSGYMRTNGYVGAFPKPALTKSWVSSNGGYWKFNAKLLSDADSNIYCTTSSTKEGFSLDDWKRRGEIISMVTPYLNKSIDVAVGFDRAITKDNVYAVVTQPSIVGTNEMTKDIEAGGLYRVLSEQIANPTNPLLKPASQKSYSTALTSTETPVLKVMEFGLYSSKTEDKGTTANLRIDLCSGANGTDISKLKSDYALMSEYVVLGAGETKQAMIQPASGEATFYATIEGAVAASPEGGTVKLCNNITSTDAITISKTVTIDTNGMEFNGSIVAGEHCKLTRQDTELDIEKYIGKVHTTYTVTKTTPEATQDTTITIEGCDLAVKYTLDTAAVGYDDWNVDFVVSSDAALDKGDFTLKGTDTSDISSMVNFPAFALEENTPIKLLENFAPQFKVTYAQLIELTGGTYTCAVVNNSDEQVNVVVKIVLSKEGEDDIVVEGSTFKGTLTKDYGIVISDDGKGISISGEGSADKVPSFTTKQKRTIEEAVIRDGVKTIGQRFFKEFTKLNKVTVGKDVTTIGEKAFYKCMSLEEIVIENPKNPNFDLSQITKAVVYQLAIDNDGKPYVYPRITITGYVEILEGKVNLTDTEWHDIGPAGTISMQDAAPYRFFRVELKKVTNPVQD